MQYIKEEINSSLTLTTKIMEYKIEIKKNEEVLIKRTIASKNIPEFYLSLINEIKGLTVTIETL